MMEQRKRKKAQGSLEYLIMIIAVLIIAAAVIYFLTSAASAQGGNVALCKQAAVSCKNTRLLTPDDPCNHCESACSDASGLDLMTRDPVTPGYSVQGSAVHLCRIGQPAQISEVTGTCDTACTLCGDETDCTGSSASCDWCGTACADTCYCSDGTEYEDCSSITQPEYCTTTGQLINSCGAPGNCDCPTGMVCQADGTCAGPPPANNPPTASFTAPPCTPNSPCTFVGTGTDSDGSIVSYGWSFGDGSTATGATTTHTYAAAGTYTVTLTVTDDDGATGSVSHSVVASFDLTADFTYVEGPLSVTVDASTSTDDGTITSYSWTWGDGSTGSGVTASHTYATAGTYTVTLTVVDDDANTDTMTRSVTPLLLADGEECDQHTDCTGNWCGGAVIGTGHNLCWTLATACADGQITVQTDTSSNDQQIETDVDCGGKCADELAKKCAADKKCLKPTDCTSDSCTSDGITLGDCFGTYYFQDNFDDADISDWTEQEGTSGSVELTGVPPTTYVASGRALKIMMPSVSSGDSALAESEKWSQDTSDHIITFKFLLAGWMTPKYADAATNDYLPLYSDAKGQIFVTDTGDTNDWEVSCFEDMVGFTEIFEVDEDTWYTVKLAHDGQGDYDIYLDGTQKATCSDTPFPFVDTSGNDCGGVNCHNYMQVGPSSYVDIFGELFIDDIKIYH